MSSAVWRRFVAAPLAAALLAFGGAAAGFRPAALPEIALTQLPPQAQETLRLIKQGGPFPYARDGSVFGNRERLLPPRERGYYREYTVKTPGARDRGARRIVAGGCALPGTHSTQRRNKDAARGAADGEPERNSSQQHFVAPCSAGEYYYTDDHYASFQRIRE